MKKEGFSKEKETIYEALLENANIGIATVNSEGVIVNTNRMMEVMFGYTKKELEGKEVTDLVPENIRERHKSKFNIYFENPNIKGYGNNIEFTGLTKGGTEIQVEINLGRFVLNSEKVLVAFIKDISDKKKAVEELKLSEQRYRSLYDNSQVAKYTVDLITLKAIDVNPVAIKLFGYKGKQDFIDHFTPMVHYENKKDSEANIKTVREKGELANKTQKLKRVDGTKFWANLYVKADADRKIMEGTIIDVTEQVVANNELKKSEEKYKGLFENSIVAMHIIDLKSMKPIEVNGYSVALFGYKSKKDFLSNFSPIKHYVNKGDVEKNLKIFEQTGELKNVEVEMQRVDGTHFWVSLNTKYGSDNTKAYTVLIDITKQMSGNMLLKANEEKYRSLYDNTLVSLFTLDLETLKAIAVNDVTVDLFGYKSKQDFLDNFSPINHFRKPEGVKENLSVLQKDGMLTRTFQEMKRLDGSVFWANTFERTNSEKTVVRIVVLDVTEQKIAHENEKVREEKFRNMFENSIVAMFSFNWVSKKMIEVNDVCVKMFGYKSAKDFSNIFHTSLHFVNEEDRKSNVTTLLNTLELNTVSEMKRLDGRRFWGNLFAKINHDKTELQAVIIDVTDSKRTHEEMEDLVEERTLELTETLEREKELNELKSRFVSTASHEFRTPLSAILSSVSILEQYNGKGTEEKKKKHLERIKRSVDNLVDILNDFLSLDKLEQGRTELTAENFNLKQFSENIVDEMSEMLKDGQKIIFDYTGEEEIMVDNKILRNVYLNLLSNAIKYSGEDKEIELTIHVTKKGAKIKVKDNGIGIPEEDQKNLFGKFYRASNAINIQGTGLGLNIVKKYLELLEGKITFASKPNQGTTFTIEFPTNKK